MAGKNQSNFLLLVATMVAILVGVCSGATHTVGGTTGWTIPPSSSSTFYSDWASKQQLQAGDVLGTYFFSNLASLFLYRSSGICLVSRYKIFRGSLISSLNYRLN